MLIKVVSRFFYLIMSGSGLWLLVALLCITHLKAQSLDDPNPSRSARASPLRWGKREGNNILRWGKREALDLEALEEDEGSHRERREAPLR